MSFQGREAISVENDCVRVTVLREGGHVAEILHKKTGVNPLWIPPWRSAEPSTYDPGLHPEYGLDAESKLLVGIMGHNLCLDLFGPPSPQEAAAGLTTHGEASVVRYEIEHQSDWLKMSAPLPLAGLTFQRELSLDGDSVIFNETVFNSTALDRPLAWTQHVTLGPPFLNGKTQFTFPAGRSRTFEDTSLDGGVMAAATDFQWPDMPLQNGGTVDLRVFSDEEAFSRFTTHLMTSDEHAGFAAFSPQHATVIGYQWRRDDFPWLGLWQEYKQRSRPPWNNRSVTCGLEFGVSPYPGTRRQMMRRTSLFGEPVYRWLPALGSAHVSYRAFVRSATQLTEDSWRWRMSR
jgi:hypothetical protein